MLAQSKSLADILRLRIKKTVEFVGNSQGLQRTSSIQLALKRLLKQ